MATVRDLRAALPHASVTGRDDLGVTRVRVTTRTRKGRDGARQEHTAWFYDGVEQRGHADEINLSDVQVFLSLGIPVS